MAENPVPKAHASYCTNPWPASYTTYNENKPWAKGISFFSIPLSKYLQ